MLFIIVHIYLSIYALTQGNKTKAKWIKLKNMHLFKAKQAKQSIIIIIIIKSL